MPIKPQDKARILAEAGVDPTKYWIDDNGEIIDMPEQGTVETALKSTLHNAPRTALGFVGSAVGMAGAGALATPETAGLATIPAALAGGAAGGMAGGAAGQSLQDWLYPESWKLAEEARMARSPITTKVADIGASMALIRPSATVFKAAARAPGEFLRTAGQLQPKTVEALANIGLGAGMRGGMAAAQGASPGEIALETALGAAQVQPTRLGTKLSGGLFKPFTTEGLAQPGGLPTAEAQARFAAALEAQNAPSQPTVTPEALAELAKQAAKQQAADAKRVEAGAIAAEGARQNEIQRLRQAEVEAAMAPAEGAPVAGSLYPFGGERPIGQTVQRGRRAVAPEVEPAVLPGDTRTIDERLAATGGAPEQQMKLTPAVQQAEEARLRGASPVEQELAMLLSPEQHKYFRDVFAKYGTEYRDVPELDASGRFVPRKSATEPSRTDISSRAYLDVYPHEALHALLSDTLNYGTARERAFTERALRELGIEVLTDANGRKSLAAGSEEALAKQVGEESIRVLAGKQKPAPVREAFSDFVDYLINDKLTPDVARRILRDRTVFGAGTRGIVARAARRGGAVAAAGAPPVTPEAAEQQQPAAQAPVEKPFEPVELPERLAPTRDMTPEQIAQVEAAREAAQTPPPAAEAEAAQAQRRADELAARAEQMKTLLDEQEARLRRLENAERMRQRISELPESPLKESRTAEYEKGLPRPDRAADFERAKIEERIAAGEGPGTDVGRMETVEYTGAPVPANVRAGVRRREAMLETPADLEARRIEERLSGREGDRDRYQPLAEDRPVFATQFQKELDSPNPLGAMPGKDGRIPANNLRTGLARLNTVERELLKNAGLDAFLHNIPRPTVAELKSWANARLPKIEIRPQMAISADFTANERELALLNHDWYENLNTDRRRLVNEAYETGNVDNPEILANFAEEERAKMNRFFELNRELARSQHLRKNAPDSATARYTEVNPRKLGDMPGAVDILVKMPGSGQDVAGEVGHYPKEGKDLVTHVRAYEHTLPDGTKALRVFELQSDWGQRRRKWEKELKTTWPAIESLDKLPDGWYIQRDANEILLRNPNDYPIALATNEQELLSNYQANRRVVHADIPDSPILSQTDSLGLKAAVEYAREHGISKLIIDDAQTAMMTEGHDRYGTKQLKPFRTEQEAKDFATTLGKTPHSIRHAKSGIWHVEYVEVAQERGMTRAYNDILPQLMRKMTGDKGTPVNMGDHWRASADGRTRDTLVFKNPDGSPKTESTGIMYDLGVPQARRAAGEPFTVSNERYQPLSGDRRSLDASLDQARELTSEAVDDRLSEIVKKIDDQYEASLNSNKLPGVVIPQLRSHLGGYVRQLVQEDPSAFAYLSYKVGDRTFPSYNYTKLDLTDAQKHSLLTGESIQLSDEAIKNYRASASNVINLLEAFKIDRAKVDNIRELLNTLVDVRLNAKNPRVELANQVVARWRNPDYRASLLRDAVRYNDKTKAQALRDLETEILSGERYQPLGPERGEYKGAKLPERERRVFGRGIFAGNVEALRRTGDPQKIEFAGAMEELYARIRNYTGQYEEGIIRPLTELSKASQQKVVEALYDESMTRQPATAGLSPDELAAHREIRAGLLKMRNDQIAANHLIEGKPAGRDPFYFPHVVDSSIIHDLSNTPESPRAKEAERQFIEFNAELFRNKGIAPAVAQRMATDAFGKFIGSLKPISVDSGFDYGAVSMPAGTKLPPTWVAADPIDGFRSYIKRFSRARAFYDVIGRDEKAMRQIGRKYYYDAAGKEAPVANPGSRLQRDPNVRALLENALGITHESQEGITPAIGRLANSLLLGNVATRLTDAATTPFKALAYLPPRYIPGLLTNMRNLRSSIDNAYKTGGVRRGDMMVVREVLGAGDRYVKGMDKIAETITKYTGSEALEKGARFLAQNVGEYIYDVNKMLADRGDKRAADFMNRVTPKWRTLAREETAQRIARLFQGNYDATNLPIWIANSPAAPFFSMMKWNIEQWNNFKRFAWEPALKGDPYALMATVLGGVAGGIAVGELREKITGKKQRVATAGELNFGFREGDKARASMEAMRKAAFLSQVTGTFGIVGELSLQAIDVASKDKPQGFSWPAYEFVSNVIGKIANAVPAAIERPEDALLITGTAANDLAKDIVAQYRILWNAADRAKGAGEVEEANRRRDLRMSEKLRGEPTRFSPFIERDYRNERERQFDKAHDRQQAIEIAKQLDARARRESATGAEYKEARRKFRTSRIVGIPSRENNPQQFYRHLQFVRDTQGAEAADRLARDYATLRTEQKWKSSMFR